MRGRVLAALCLCALFSLCAAAETETDGLYSRVESIFADAFFEEVGKVLFSQSSAVAGNRVASLKMNGDVYVYDAETDPGGSGSAARERQRNRAGRGVQHAPLRSHAQL